MSDVIQKVQRHHDLINAHAVRKTTFISQHATMQLICKVTDKCVYFVTLVNYVTYIFKINDFLALIFLEK